MVQAIIQFAITCIIGWVVVERVLCYFREVKTPTNGENTTAINSMAASDGGIFV